MLFLPPKKYDFLLLLWLAAVFFALLNYLSSSSSSKPNKARGIFLKKVLVVYVSIDSMIVNVISNFVALWDYKSKKFH